MFGSFDLIILPLLAGVGAFALVGLIWNLTEAYFDEERRNQQR